MYNILMRLIKTTWPKTQVKGCLKLTVIKRMVPVPQPARAQHAWNSVLWVLEVRESFALLCMKSTRTHAHTHAQGCP